MSLGEAFKVKGVFAATCRLVRFAIITDSQTVNALTNGLPMKSNLVILFVCPRRLILLNYFTWDTQFLQGILCACCCLMFRFVCVLFVPIDVHFVCFYVCVPGGSLSWSSLLSLRISTLISWLWFFGVTWSLGPFSLFFAIRFPLFLWFELFFVLFLFMLYFEHGNSWLTDWENDRSVDTVQYQWRPTTTVNR